MKRPLKITGVVLLLSPLLLPAAVWFATSFLPRFYASTAVIEIKNHYLQEEYAGSADFPILQSDDILDLVIDHLGLEKKWGGQAGAPAPGQVRDQLRQMLKIRWRPDTDLVEINVTAHDPQEAAGIANAIAGAYQQRTRDDMQKLTNMGVSGLKEDVAAHREKVTAAAAEMDRLSRIDRAPNDNSMQDLRDFDNTLTRIDDLKAQISQLDDMTPEELQDTYNVTEDRIDTVRQNLEDRLSTEQQNLDNLTKKSEATYAAQLATKAAIDDYYQARDHYLDEKKQFDDAGDNLAKEMARQRTSSSLVIMRQRAEPAARPFKPDVNRYIKESAIAGIFLAVLGGLLLRAVPATSAAKTAQAQAPLSSRWNRN